MIIDSIILARKDSKGIPHKNTIDFCGKPLIEWTIIQLKKTMKTGEIWVSSDGSKILDIAKKHNVNLIERPSDLSKDNSSSEDAWMHALRIIKKKKKVEVILAPQVTSPLREPSDFSNAIKLFKSSKADSLLSVCEIEDFFFWNYVNNKPVPANYDYKKRQMRQFIKKKYLENGSFYIFKKSLLEKKKCRLGGKIVVFPMEKFKMFQIDNKNDLDLCSVIMKGYKLDRC